MKFHYKNYGAKVERPVIPIEVVHGNVAVPYEVLVDSGADVCIFDSQIADLLGIDIEAGNRSELSGITGIPESLFVHPVTLSVGGWKYEVEVGFLSRMAPLGYGVVGQRGFFDIFIVKFDLLKREIELKERPRK